MKKMRGSTGSATVPVLADTKGMHIARSVREHHRGSLHTRRTATTAYNPSAWCEVEAMRKPWQPRQPRDWWLHNPAYRRYMLREATALPLLLYALLLLAGIYQLARGPDAFSAWLAWLQTPAMLLLQGIALAAALLHAVTWVALVPKILVIDGDRLRIAPRHVLRAHQLAALGCNLGLITATLWLLWPVGGH